MLREYAVPPDGVCSSKSVVLLKLKLPSEFCQKRLNTCTRSRLPPTFTVWAPRAQRRLSISSSVFWSSRLLCSTGSAPKRMVVVMDEPSASSDRTPFTVTCGSGTPNWPEGLDGRGFFSVAYWARNSLLSPPPKSEVSEPTRLLPRSL